MISTYAIADSKHGNFQAFIADRQPNGMNDEQLEACMREAYQIALQIVLVQENDFSAMSRNCFPLIAGKRYDVDSVRLWFWQMSIWLRALSATEQQAFNDVKFFWV